MRHPRHRRRRLRFGLASLVVALGVGTVLLTAGGHAPARHPASAAPAVSAADTRLVGAVLVRHGSAAPTQVCSGAVVDSTSGDVVVTAAHCLTSSGTLLFAPDYRNGVAPYGMWAAVSTHTDAAWQDHGDPDDDYAFLTVRPTSSVAHDRAVQRVVGGAPIGLAPLSGDEVTVVGYPVALDGASVSCRALVRATREFPTVDCLGFSSGTSGGPLLRTDGARQMVVGVIGGLEAGGCTDDISYASPFTATAWSVLAGAERDGPSSPPPRTTPPTDC